MKRRAWTRLEEGWPTLLLLAWSIFLTFQTIAEAGWGERVELVSALALLGVTVGVLGAKSALRPLWSLSLSLAIGFESLILSQALLTQGQRWQERLGQVSSGLWGWYASAINAGVTHDQLAFSTALGAVAYLIGLCSSWLVFRFANGWLPVVISATIGLIHLSYATVQSIPGFLFSLVVGLLAVASLALHRRRSTWLAVGVPVQASSTLWTLVSAGLLVGVALGLAYQLPAGQLHTELAARYEALVGPWKETQRMVDRFVGGSRGQARPAGGLTFGQSLVPREEFEVGTEPLLKVASTRPVYLRTTSYDRYDGRSIQVGTRSERRYAARQPLEIDPDGALLRQEREYLVTVLAPSASAAFGPDAPLVFSQPIVVDERIVAWDQAGLRLAEPLQRGQSYTVRSAASLAGRWELGEASRSYPSWLDPYLELPASLPVRVGELTNRITADAATPFERATVIENYVRGLAYSTSTVAPPPDRDWVDFVLFDSRAGYCDYLATTMTVMLRTQGIPARVASGFAPGRFDEGERAWIVTEAEAHSWVEVRFPGFGWQIFEPSATRQPPERPESARPGSTAGGAGSGPGGGLDDEAAFGDEILDDAAGAARGARLEPNGPGRALLLLGGLVLLVGVTGWLMLRAWERGLVGQPAAVRRYVQVRRLLGWAGPRAGESSTPYEVARAAAERRPALSPALLTLADCYVAVAYGQSGEQSLNESAERAWRELRRPLLIATVRRRLGLSSLDGPARADTLASK